MYVHKNPDLFQDKNWLIQKYNGERLSAEEMAGLASCTQRTIFNWMQKHGIRRRKLGEHIKGDKNPMRKINAKQFRKNCIHKKDCSCFICKSKRGEKINHKSSCKCMKCRMKKGEFQGKNNPMYGKGFRGKENPMYGYVYSEEEIERRRMAAIGKNNPMYGRSKEKAPNWRGGLSFLPYPPNFDHELKESIRARDNYMCQICGKTQEDNLTDFSKRFAVHHIDYDKNNNHPSNLISLCMPCHCGTNFKRKYWKNYFKEN